MGPCFRRDDSNPYFSASAVTESQKAGMAVLVLFFVAGLGLLGRVRD